MWQETASHFPAETFGFGVHNWWLKVCFANFFNTFLVIDLLK